MKKEVRFLFENKVNNIFVPNAMPSKILNNFIKYVNQNKHNECRNEFIKKYNTEFPYTTNHDLIREDRFDLVSEIEKNDYEYFGGNRVIYLYYIGTSGNMNCGLNQDNKYDFTGYFENISSEIKNIIINKKNVYLYLNQNQEKITEDNVLKIYKDCLNKKIPPNKIMLSSDNFDYFKIKQSLENQYKIDCNIKFFNYPWALYQAAEMLDFLDEQNNIVKKIKYNRDKKFLCFNRNLKQNKVLVILYLLGKYEKDTFLSFDINRLPPNYKKSLEDILKIFSIKDLYIGYEKMMNIKKSIIDVDDLNSGMELLYDDKKIYEDSYFSLVTETETESGRITEKTFKPIINQHPFIIWGSPGSLKYLKYYNFKSFSEFIDEKYDNEFERYDERYKHLLNTIDSVGKMNKEKLDELTKQISNILIYNRKLLEKYNHNSMLIDFIKNIFSLADNTFSNQYYSIIEPKTI